MKKDKEVELHRTVKKLKIVFSKELDPKEFADCSDRFYLDCFLLQLYEKGEQNENW